VCGLPLHVRVGVHVGDVCAAFVGRDLPRYHIYGEASETAALIEAAAERDSVALSAAAAEALAATWPHTRVRPVPGLGGSALAACSLAPRDRTRHAAMLLGARRAFPRLAAFQDRLVPGARPPAGGAPAPVPAAPATPATTPGAREAGAGADDVAAAAAGLCPLQSDGESVRARAALCEQPASPPGPGAGPAAPADPRGDEGWHGSPRGGRRGAGRLREEDIRCAQPRASSSLASPRRTRRGACGASCFTSMLCRARRAWLQSGAGPARELAATPAAPAAAAAAAAATRGRLGDCGTLPGECSSDASASGDAGGSAATPPGPATRLPPLARRAGPSCPYPADAPTPAPAPPPRHDARRPEPGEASATPGAGAGAGRGRRAGARPPYRMRAERARRAAPTDPARTLPAARPVSLLQISERKQDRPTPASPRAADVLAPCRPHATCNLPNLHAAYKLGQRVTHAAIVRRRLRRARAGRSAARVRPRDAGTPWS
jgi:hypothetical protein